MNSESEQRLSLQELKQRNSQQTVLPVQPPPPEARPTKADWERMMNDLDTLWYHADRQTALLESVSRQMSQLPTRTQLDDLLKMVRHLEQMTEQAGKPKENSFSLHRIRLPRLHLPHVSIPALISLLMAAGSTASALVGLGHRLEQLQSAAPVMPARHYTDRKALQKEREKKIALGHKADDHEDEVSYDWQQTM